MTVYFDSNFRFVKIVWYFRDSIYMTWNPIGVKRL